ncbi:MAG: DoxX family protein [Actinobacteria bacterium]|nr:MAG: DoxX family protein [Actinomycetota bacterium]
MNIAYAVVAVIYSLVLVMSVRMKLVRDPRAIEVIGDVVGVPLRLFPLLGALELAGAAGLLVGIEVEAVGVAAGVGLVGYFVGATASHIRARDFVPEHIFPALVLLAVSAAALALGLAA